MDLYGNMNSLLLGAGLETFASFGIMNLVMFHCVSELFPLFPFKLLHHHFCKNCGFILQNSFYVGLSNQRAHRHGKPGLKFSQSKLLGWEEI